MSEVENTEKLIELIRERSLLYDLNDADYKNREKKAEAWLEIATNMGFGDSKVWIAKWKNIRDNFNKYKKSTEYSTAQAYKKYKSWPWASQMSFLDDFNFRRQTESNGQRSETETSKKIMRKRIKTSAGPSDNDKILEYIKHKNEQQTKIDGVDHFFLSYAQTCKTFPPRMQSMVKLEIASLFARYELQVAEGSDSSNV